MVDVDADVDADADADADALLLILLILLLLLAGSLPSSVYQICVVDEPSGSPETVGSTNVTVADTLNKPPSGRLLQDPPSVVALAQLTITKSLARKSASS